MQIIVFYIQNTVESVANHELKPVRCYTYMLDIDI